LARESRLLAERECRAHLNPRGAESARLLELPRRCLAAGQPERKTQRADLFEIRHIARTIHWFPGCVELHAAARRRIMPTCNVALDDKAVDAARRLASKGERQGRR